MFFLWLYILHENTKSITLRETGFGPTLFSINHPRLITMAVIFMKAELRHLSNFIYNIQQKGLLASICNYFSSKSQGPSGQTCHVLGQTCPVLGQTCPVLGQVMPPNGTSSVLWKSYTRRLYIFQEIKLWKKTIT